MDLTGSVNFTHVTGTVNTVISVTVRFIHVEILQQAENGLKAKTYGTARNACGCTKRMQLNA